MMIKPIAHAPRIRERRSPLRRVGLFALIIALMPAYALARDFEMGGDSDYSIMAPEPGTAEYRAAAARKKGQKTGHGHASSQQAAKPAEMLPAEPSHVTHNATSKQMRRHIGSSGSVLPTPLPRTPNIPPVGGTTFAQPNLSQSQGSTLLPPLPRPIPNLSHGPETFQDRASRCSLQSGLNGIPNGLSQRYVGGCVQ